MTPVPRPHDEIGAHVSAAGGPASAPARAAELDSVVLQLFTKQPSRWAEPEFDAATAGAWRAERARNGIRAAGAHDSYLINLASPRPELFRRSLDSFRRELVRCGTLGLDFLVTHPGNATDGDRASALRRNGDAIAQAVLEAGAPTRVLLEGTAGSGSALGSTFEELALLLERIDAAGAGPAAGICLDTCHLFAAGYDLARDYDGVLQRLADTIPLERVRLFHLNDSVHGLGSRRDRHAHIGAGCLGDEPFRRLLLDDRFTAVPKLIETPKDGDPRVADHRNLARLRSYRA